MIRLVAGGKTRQLLPRLFEGSGSPDKAGCRSGARFTGSDYRNDRQNSL
jgi:hypothetical protein